MKNLSTSLKIYIGLVVIDAVLVAVIIFLPQGSFLPVQELPASKSVLAFVNAATVLILYGGLGLIGILLSQKLGYAEIWDPKVRNIQRFVIPLLIGMGMGIFFILADGIFTQFHTIGPIPHPPFPTSLVASATAGIGEELIFRLFFISFWVWLISYVILKKKWQNTVFWIFTLISALAFAAGHLPALKILYGFNAVNEIPYALLTEIIILNGLLSILAAFYFRKYGFLAAVGIHFWTDVVWHVIWGVI